MSGEVSIMFELIKIFEKVSPSAFFFRQVMAEYHVANTISCVLPDKMISVFF